MDSTTNIAPGSLVHGTNGAVGTVESVEQEDDRILAIDVRSADGLRLYRVPAEAVRKVRRENGKAIVVLDRGADMLDPYLVETTPARDLESQSIAMSEANAETPTTVPSYSPTAPTMLNTPVSTAPTAPQMEDVDELRLPIYAEELTTETRPISLGNVHIHKGIETQRVTMRVPVTREEAVIEHIRPEDYDPAIRLDADETIIPIVEEKIVYEKRLVVTEYLRIRKNRVVDEQEVSGELRREYVEVVEQPREDAQSGDAPLFRVVRNSL